MRKTSHNYQHGFICPETDHEHTGKHRDVTEAGRTIARARDDYARDRKDAGLPELYVGKHRAKTYPLTVFRMVEDGAA